MPAEAEAEVTNNSHRDTGTARGALALVILALVAVALTPAARAAAALTLERVMLSSGGVGYFEYRAQVDGDAELSLTVPLDQMDDVLKSIVIYDDRGGLGHIRLPSREPLGQIFRDLPFGPEALESPAALLNALRGAEVHAVGGRDIQGRLLRVTPETTTLPNGLGTVVKHRISLITAHGVQQILLEDAESVRFVDTALQRQVETALAALASHRAGKTRELRIVSGGQGARTVRVGYVVAAALWKTSYRLTLPAAGEGGRARLQGWAMIDNLSGQDWNRVALTLVSGNPVTFRQALYAAYFVDRPEVPVEVVGRVLPRQDEGAIAFAMSEMERDERFRRGRADQKKDKAELRQRRLGKLSASAPAELMMDTVHAQSAGEVLAAATEEAATQVVFHVPFPVTAGVGESLMLPIADREVPGDRLALYQPDTHARHPLAAIRLKNDTDTGLPPGVLTLYEVTEAGDTSYIGDARLGVLPAGEERLLSFAVDQKMRAEREVRNRRRIAKGKIDRGVFQLTLLDRRTTVYRLKAPAREPRVVLIEHPRRRGWKLVAPAEKDTEITATHYRIRHRLAPGEQARIEVVAQRPRLETITLSELARPRLAFYAETGELSPELRRAFARMAELRGAIDERARRLDHLGGARKRIFEEQERIRENLRRVPSNSDLQRRYLQKLDAQEDEVERILAGLDDAQAALDHAHDALTSYIAGLKL